MTHNNDKKIDNTFEFPATPNQQIQPVQWFDKIYNTRNDKD